MRILHVWDQAGVSCVLAKHLRSRGHGVDVIKRVGFDNYGIMRFYGDLELNMDGAAYTDFVLHISRYYDIIHIHSARELIKPLKKLYPKKKYVIHYHGWEIRHDSTPTEANLSLVSTPDLLQYTQATYLPNPVDTEHFNNAGYKPTLDTLYNITTTYDRMPKILKMFRRYVDQKYENEVLLKAYSLLGLQALSCGLTVLNHEDKEVTGLPEQHKPENVVSSLVKMYESIL